MSHYARMNDGANIHYRYDHKEGKPTLLLSNSLGTTMDMWSPQLAEFSQHFSVLRYDTRGHGGSDTTAGAYSMDRLGNDILGLLDHLQLDSVYFCGLSIGGMMGQWLAAFHPQRINALVLANTAPVIAPASLWQERIQQVQQHSLDSIWSNILSRWVTDEFVKQHPEQVSDMHRMFLQNNPQGYTACCAAIRDMDMRKLAPLNRLPTLLIAGQQDLATPPAQSEYLLSQYPHGRLIELNAGHLSNIEQAQKFTEAVLDFLLVDF